MSVYRIYVEKKPRYAVEGDQLQILYDDLFLITLADFLHQTVCLFAASRFPGTGCLPAAGFCAFGADDDIDQNRTVFI